MELELWTVLPVVFLGSLLFLSFPDYDLTYIFTFNFIVSLAIGLIYLGEGTYKLFKKDEQ